MKKLIINLILLLLTLPAIYSQECYTRILNEIENNSKTLSVLKEQMEAQKLSNKTGIYLSNPEIEFHYLWGHPTNAGNRMDFSIKQEFDFPSAYNYRSEISKAENNKADLQYKSERLTLLLNAKYLIIELIYYNALLTEYSKRYDNALLLAEGYKKRLDKGETNIIESNKAQLNFTSVSNTISKVKIERDRVLSELKILNGGNDINLTTDVFPMYRVPVDFESWYNIAESKNPVLQYIKEDLAGYKNKVSLNRANSLPKLSAGYISERGVEGDGCRGVLIGITIPLWENKNIIKQAKSEARAAEYFLDDSKIQFYNRLQNLYMSAVNLHRIAVESRESLNKFNNESYLKKALDCGEISLLDYLLELEYYYDAFDTVLGNEKEFEFINAELNSVEL